MYDVVAVGELDILKIADNEIQWLTEDEFFDRYLASGLIKGIEISLTAEVCG